MYQPEEMNLVLQLAGTAPDKWDRTRCVPADFPGRRAIHGYLSCNHRLLLFCTGDTGTNVCFAALADTRDIEQIRVLMESMLHDAYSFCAELADLLAFLGITEEQLQAEWLCLTEECWLFDCDRTAEEYAAKLYRTAYLTYAECDARCGDCDYLPVLEGYLKRIERAKNAADQAEFDRLYDGLQRVIAYDLCLLVADDPRVRETYCLVRRNRNALCDRAHTW